MTTAQRRVDPPVHCVATGAGVRILLVDQEGPWRARLSDYLEDEGYQCVLAGHVEEAEALLKRSPADLIVLQARHGGSELGLCRRLSAQDGAPVILVSDRAQEVDRIVGLEVGADDFITGACSLRELLARIRAVLRRQVRRAHPAREAPSLEAPADGSDEAALRFAGWTLSPWKLEVRSSSGERSVLTVSDFRLLSALLEQPQTTITRERMARRLGLLHSNLRSLDTAVCRLRRKLGTTSAGEPLIRTVHGLGYMLNCPVERETGAVSKAWRGGSAAG